MELKTNWVENPGLEPGQALSLWDHFLTVLI